MVRLFAVLVLSLNLSGCLFFYAQRSAPADPQPTAQAVGIDQSAADRVEAVHPGWMQTVASNEFRVWKSLQNQQVQRLSASPDPADAIEVLNLFKRDRPKWR